MFSISCVGSQVCYAAGSFGTILASHDHGATWVPVRSGTHADLGSIACAASHTCAVITATSFRFTRNSGRTWTRHVFRRIDFPQNLTCPTVHVCFVQAYNTTQGCAVPNCKHSRPTFDLLASNDSGQTWHSVHIPVTLYLYAFACASSSHCLAAGGHGAVYQTSNAGRTWTRSYSIPGRQFGQEITCPTPRVCYFAFVLQSTRGPDRGFWLSTTDGGRNWTRRALPVAGFSDISCPSARTCVLALGRNGLLLTRNGGRTWRAISSEVQLGNQIACENAMVCHVLGRASQILTTQDGGARWSSSVQGPLDDIFHLACPTKDDCFALTTDAYLLASADAGATWTQRRTPLSGNNLYQLGLSCPAATVCLVAGPNGEILRTDDAGVHWQSLHNPLSGTSLPLNGIDCPTSVFCIAAGSGCLHPGCVGPNGSSVIVRTTDGGRTWRETMMRQSGSLILNAVDCPETRECFVTGSPGEVFVTRDGGTTWQELDSVKQNTDADLTAISCADVLHCAAVGYGCADSQGCTVGELTGAIEVTADGGLTWSNRDVRIPVAFRGGSKSCGYQPLCYGAASFGGVSCRASGICWIAGSNGVILRSVDEGDHWQRMPRVTDMSFSDIACTAPGVCYAAGSGGMIFRYS